MYRRFYSSVVYPLYHRLIRSGAGAAINEMAVHDTLSIGDMREIQQHKLRNLLQHASASVPYYRKLFNESGFDGYEQFAVEDLAILPTLTKEKIRSHTNELLSSDLEGNGLDPNSTSGSTGSPLDFFTDRRSKSFRKATVVRNRSWIGIRAGEPVVHLWGSPLDQRKAESVRGRLHSLITQETYLNAYSASDTDFARYAKYIRSFRPALLIGYPSILSEFARFCVHDGQGFPSLRAIISSAEALYPRDRDCIESGFEVPLYNRYGCREVGDIAHEVQGANGLYVNSDRIYLEIVDESGRPCPAGVMGRLLVTDLDNYGMPLIRYDIGDLGEWSDVPDRKLPYPILRCVDGRSLDVVSTPEGKRIGGTFWTILLRKRPGMASFQVVQNSLDGITINYTQDTNDTEIDFDYFKGEIRKTCGQSFDVRFRSVNRIYPESSGKFRVVKSSIVKSQVLDVLRRVKNGSN